MATSIISPVVSASCLVQDPSQKQSKKHLSWTMQEPFGSAFSSGDVQNGSVVTQADVLAEESTSLFASML